MHALLLALTLAGSAQEGGDALARHRDLEAAATTAERAGHAGEAVRLCTEAIAALPDGPRARRCAERVAYLEARRDADGSFAGWDALAAVRKTYGDQAPEARRSAVVALLAREGLSEATRSEAALWLAADDLDRRRDPAAALAASTPVYDARTALDEATRLRAVLLQATALAKLGRFDEASAVEEEVRVAAAWPRATPVQAEARRQRLAFGVPVAWGLMGLFGLAALPLAARGLRRPSVPWGLLPLLLLTGLTWLLVYQRDDAADEAFPAMTAGFVVVHALTAVARPATGSAALRGLLAALSALATGAVAYLALHATNTLAWVGL